MSNYHLCGDTLRLMQFIQQQQQQPHALHSFLVQQINVVYLTLGAINLSFPRSAGEYLFIFFHHDRMG